MEELQTDWPVAGPGRVARVHSGAKEEGHGSLLALCVLARMHQTAADPQTLAHQLGLHPSEAASVQDLLRAAKHLGLKARLSRCDTERLPLTPLPALALVRGADGGTRAVVLAQCDGQRVLVQDPAAHGAQGRPTTESMEAFTARWTGELIRKFARR